MRQYHRWAIASLTVVLVVQALLLGRSEGGPSPETGPVTDSLLPTLPIKLLEGQAKLELRDLLLQDTGCTLTVVMDVNCAICQRMRIEWPRRFAAWADSVGGPLKAVWLVADSYEDTKRFFGSPDPDRIIRAQITSDPDNAFRALGVIGTPMMYLVDGRGQMRMGIAGNQFPAPLAVKGLCAAN